MPRDLHQPGVVSIPDHTARFVARNDDGVLCSLWHWDLLGRLIWTPVPQPAGECPFNASSRVLQFRDEATWTQPWHAKRGWFERQVQAFVEEAPAPMGETIEALFPGKQIPVTDWLWLPFRRPDAPAPEPGEIETVIDAMEHPNANPRLVERALNRLAEYAVAPLPEIQFFASGYHNCQDKRAPAPGEPVTTAHRGWSDNGTVRRKATVTTIDGAQ